MNKWITPSRNANEANHQLVRYLKDRRSIEVRPIRFCTNCNEPATVEVTGGHPRCQPCANHLVSLWSETKAELDEALADPVFSSEVF